MILVTDNLHMVGMFKLHLSYKYAFCPVQSFVIRTRVRYCLDVVEYPLGLGCYGTACFMTAMRVILVLSGSAPGLSWLAVFAPIVMQGFAFVLAIIVGVCTQLCSVHAPLGDCCNGQHEASQRTCYFFATHAARKTLGVSGSSGSQQTGIKARIGVCLFLLTFSAFVSLVLIATPILVAFRLQVWAPSCLIIQVGVLLFNSFAAICAGLLTPGGVMGCNIDSILVGISTFAQFTYY